MDEPQIRAVQKVDSAVANPGYATYVGRVGALAVALGVGAAIASMPFVAYADTSGSSGSTGESEGGSSVGASRSTGHSGQRAAGRGAQRPNVSNESKATSEPLPGSVIGSLAVSAGPAGESHSSDQLGHKDSGSSKAGPASHPRLESPGSSAVVSGPSSLPATGQAAVPARSNEVIELDATSGTAVAEGAQEPASSAAPVATASP